jgi:hypothetical protein
MSTLPPRELVEQDWALEQGIESDTIRLYQLRWEATNPDEPGSFTFEAYAEARSAVGRKISKTQVRDTARAYAAWLADAEANDGEAVYSITQHAAMMRVSATKRTAAVTIAEDIARLTGEKPDPVRVLKDPVAAVEVMDELDSPPEGRSPTAEAVRVLTPVPDPVEPSEAHGGGAEDELGEDSIDWDDDMGIDLTAELLEDLEKAHELLASITYRLDVEDGWDADELDAPTKALAVVAANIRGQVAEALDDTVEVASA